MKSLEDLLVKPKKNENKRISDTSSVDVVNNQVLVSGNEETPEVEPADITEVEIPDYILHDPTIVGYPQGLAFQQQIYNYALSQTIPITGGVVLDVGCGRGDLFGQWDGILSKYVGVDTNAVLIEAGKKKYEGIDLYNVDFLDTTNPVVNKEYDVILHVTDLNQNYALNRGLVQTLDDWSYFNLMLDKSLQLAKSAVVFILQQYNQGEVANITYPIPNMADELLKRNLRFNIDYEYPSSWGIYKLIIYK